MDNIRVRLLAGDTYSHSASDLLEALINFGSKRHINASSRAKFFLRQFGSLGEIISEDTDVLLQGRKIEEDVVVLFRLVQAVATHIIREEVKSRDIISSIDSLLEYCKVSMSRLRHERFVALFLDVKNGLINEMTINGTVNHTPVYPRDIAKHALAHNAISIILVHNHPSGDPSPSLADIQMTDKIVSTCRTVGVRVIDHFIIGQSRYTSFRQAGLFRDENETELS